MGKMKVATVYACMGLLQTHTVTSWGTSTKYKCKKTIHVVK
jgi:hypothetical protein